MGSRTGVAGIVLAAMAFVPAAHAVDHVNMNFAPPRYRVWGDDIRDQLSTWHGSGPQMGDLNGDGIRDMVIGAHHARGRLSGVSNTGEVHVLFGPLQEGAQRDLAIEPADIVIYAREDTFQLGRSILVADVNLDGLDDLVVGQPMSEWRDIESQDWVRGEIDFFFGPLSPGTVFLETTAPDLIVIGPHRTAGFGTVLLAGDVSGDGILDLVVSGELADEDQTRLHEGKVWAVFGPFHPGPPRRLDLVPPDVTLRGRRIEYSGFGEHVAVGDVSGDGIDDIVVGLQNSTAPPASGEVFAVLGGMPSGTLRDFEFDAPDIRMLGAAAGDDLGCDVAVTDLTGDGVSELIALAHDGVGPGQTGRPGTVSVVRGPVAAGTVIDHVTRLPDLVLFAGTGMGNLSLFGLTAGTSANGRGLLSVPFSTPSSLMCPTISRIVVLDELPPGGGFVPFSDLDPHLTMRDDSGVMDGVFMADFDGDGETELMYYSESDGPAGDRAGCGSLTVVPRDPYCESDPPDLVPSALRLRRSGDNVVLDIDLTGLDLANGNTLDVFRGTIDSLHVGRVYDHALLPGGCQVVAAPVVDVGGATPLVPTAYYFAASGCNDACTPNRRYAGGGGATSGPHPIPSPPVLQSACP